MIHVFKMVGLCLFSGSLEFLPLSIFYFSSLERTGKVLANNPSLQTFDRLDSFVDTFIKSFIPFILAA